MWFSLRFQTDEFVNNIANAYIEIVSNATWEKHVHEVVSGISSVDECGLSCNFDSQCEYYTVADSKCLMGNVDNSATSSVTYQTPKTIFLVKGTHKKLSYNPFVIIMHSFRIPASSKHILDYSSMFSNVALFMSDAWNSLVYHAYEYLEGDSGCAAACLLDENHCHFFVFFEEKCYLGSSTAEPTNLLTNYTLPFYHLPSKDSFCLCRSGTCLANLK